MTDLTLWEFEAILRGLRSEPVSINAAERHELRLLIEKLTKACEMEIKNDTKKAH